ncbi:hypothetical protein ACHAXR_006727 [Thalassiosira sp. AJA248-18]
MNYGADVTSRTPWQPEKYHLPSVVKIISGFPRYGYTSDINAVLSGGAKNDYVQGIVISSCCLLLVLVVWCILLIFCRIYSNNWLSGYLERPPVPPKFLSLGPHVNFYTDEEIDDDDTSSTSASSRSHGSVCSGMSIDSSIFWSDPSGQEELTMAGIAREQERDEFLHKSRKKRPQNYSTTTNGQLTLITTLDHLSEEHGGSFPQFRVYIPPSVRLPLLRTYHDCLVYPDDVSNAHTMIYEFFTWKDIRRDVFQYVNRYRQYMEQEDNTAVVRYGDFNDEDSLENTPITLDLIARMQSEDSELAHMMERAPSVFSTATNGSILLITARGKDKKYRIVIPASLQAKVLKTYHDCLVNPAPENSFKKVLYVHFTWNGIHHDVENYVLNEGLTKEMRARKVHRMRLSDGIARLKSKSNLHTDVELNRNVNEFSFHRDEEGEPNSSSRPIGLDEIAEEQKKDKELRQLKKEEPFVFSTVRYGNTLLTTAHNFRDNKYRIVIPRRLQGRMLKTYQECLLYPTPDRNFDTLLYNHFTWNGIHDDVNYFVKNGGHLREKDYDHVDNEKCSTSIPWDTNFKGKKEAKCYTQDMGHNKKFERMLIAIRIAFLVSGLFVIISSIMFFEQGVNRVYNLLHDGQRGLQHIQDLVNAALSVTGDYLEVQSDIQDTARDIGSCFSHLCCHQESISDFALQISNSTYEIGVQLRDTAFRVELEIKGIEHDLERLENIVQYVGTILEDFKSHTAAAKILVIFIDIIVLSLMAFCILAWMGVQHFVLICMRETVIIPLFVVLLFLIWMFSTAALLGAMASADFCSVPDESAAALITRFQGQSSPLVFMLLVYYITGCLPERHPTKLETLSSALSSIGLFLHSQLNAAAEVTQQPGLSELYCGEAGLSNLISVLELTDAVVHGMYGVLMGVREILECHNFNPIYTTLVYDAFCNSGVAGLSWVFFTSLSMAIFIMFMVTLRVAIHQY